MNAEMNAETKAEALASRACGCGSEATQGKTKGVEMRVHNGARMLLRRTRAVGKDAGMVTSEYAMGLIAAVGFAGLLYKVVTSGQVRAALQAVVEKALHASF